MVGIKLVGYGSQRKEIRLFIWCDRLGKCNIVLVSDCRPNKSLCSAYRMLNSNNYLDIINISQLSREMDPWLIYSRASFLHNALKVYKEIKGSGKNIGTSEVHSIKFFVHERRRIKKYEVAQSQSCFPTIPSSNLPTVMG